MTTRALFAILMTSTLAAGACAGRAAAPPAAAVRQPIDTSWLAGEWQGTLWEIGASQYQGERDFSVTFDRDGSWRASTGAWGTSEVRDGRVVLDGVRPDGARIRYTLKERERGGRDEMWGTVEASFGHASLSLTRVR